MATNYKTEMHIANTGDSAMQCHGRAMPSPAGGQSYTELPGIFPGSVWRAEVRVGPGRGGISASRVKICRCNETSPKRQYLTNAMTFVQDVV